jgi:hypothetical protein
MGIGKVKNQKSTPDRQESPTLYSGDESEDGEEWLLRS